MPEQENLVQELLKISTCRKYLKVVSLSNMTNALRTATILIYVRKDTHSSKLYWLNIKNLHTQKQNMYEKNEYLVQIQVNSNLKIKMEILTMPTGIL